MFDFYDLALFSFLIPSLSQEFKLTHTEEAWLLGVALGASGIGGILFGWLADRYGVRRVALGSLTAFGLVFASFALIPGTLTWYYGLWTLIGLVGIGSTAVGDRKALLASLEPAVVAVAIDGVSEL